jgi:hypothetical protein
MKTNKKKVSKKEVVVEGSLDGMLELAYIMATTEIIKFLNDNKKKVD